MKRLNISPNLLGRACTRRVLMNPAGGLLASALLLGSACQSGTDVRDAPPEAARASAPLLNDEDPGAGSVADPANAPPSAEGNAPADAETIAGLLRARHAEDLPDAAQLHTYATAEASLRWLSTHGESALMKTRATASLRFFDSAETGALLREMLSEPSTHPMLRAAALRGLQGQNLSLDDAAFALAHEALADADPRVSRAAVEALAGEERGRVALRAALDQGTLSEATLAQIRALVTTP